MPKARLQLGSRKSPEDQLPTCCRPSWGARSSHPAAAGLPGRARRPEAEAPAAGSPRRPSRGRGRSSRPSPRRFSGPRARLAGRGRGAEPGGPVSRGPPQKSPGYRRPHWSPGQRAACPGADQLGVGDSGLLGAHSLLQATGSYMPPCAPTSTPCPHAPAPATGKGRCVFSSLLLSRCLCVLGSGLGLRSPILPCSRGAQLSRCCWSAHPRGRVPDHAYRVCVRTRTSPELKILRHAWNS